MDRPGIFYCVLFECKSRPVFKGWLEEHKEHIEVFYLPAYSPELNPDEYLNNDLKQTICQRRRCDHSR